jgi:hypothetical protein
MIRGRWSRVSVRTQRLHMGLAPVQYVVLYTSYEYAAGARLGPAYLRPDRARLLAKELLRRADEIEQREKKQ